MIERFDPEHGMTVPGTQYPAHLRHHGRTLLAVDFDRCERLGVPA
jgi:hypothetical protein